MSFKEQIARFTSDSALQCCLNTFATAISEVAVALRTAKVSTAGTSNSFGDEQLSVDLLADEKFFAAAQRCPHCRYAASEERPELTLIASQGAGCSSSNNKTSFAVVWDPLDGSSIVDCNWTVGAIFGVWRVGEGEKSITDKGEATLLQRTGREMEAAMLAVFGPKTMLLVATSLSVPPAEFCLGSDGKTWTLARPSVTIPSGPAKIFAPANLRAQQDCPEYEAWLRECYANKLTLRYSGGLVPDVYQIFIKGHVIFANPVSPKAPAKLRIVFEVAPIAFLIEAANGGTWSASGMSALDVPITSMDMRVRFACGTRESIENLKESLTSPADAKAAA